MKLCAEKISKSDKPLNLPPVFSMKIKTISFCFFYVVLLVHTSFAASDDLQPYNVTVAQQELNRIAQTDLQTASLAQIEIVMLQVEAYADQGKQCVSMVQQELDQIDKALAALGEKVTDEPPDIAKERRKLLAQKSGNEVRRAQCRLLTLRTNDLLQKLQLHKKQVFTRDLFSRGQNILTTITQQETLSSNWVKEAASFFMSRSGIALLFPWHFFPLVLFTGLGFLIGYRIDSLFSRYADTIQYNQERFIIASRPWNALYVNFFPHLVYLSSHQIARAG